jgi:Fe-S-cluster containining protein
MFLLRFFIQAVMLIIEAIMWPPERLAAFLIASFKKSEYVRRGKCRQTGQCCLAIGMVLPRWIIRRVVLVRIIQAWHRLRYNFTPVEVQDNMLVYECCYLTPKNSCGIYWRRPALCRNFPSTPLYGFPKLHEGCGFCFVKREAKRFEEVLQKIRGSRPHVE